MGTLRARQLRSPPPFGLRRLVERGAMTPEANADGAPEANPDQAGDGGTAPEASADQAGAGGSAPEANPSRAELGLRSSTRDPEEMRAALEDWLDAPGRRPGAQVQSVAMPERTGISSLTLLFEVSVPGGGSPERLVARL